MGFSILSLIEILYYVTLRSACNSKLLNKRRKKAKGIKEAQVN